MDRRFLHSVSVAFLAFFQKLAARFRKKSEAAPSPAPPVVPAWSPEGQSLARMGEAMRVAGEAARSTSEDFRRLGSALNEVSIPVRYAAFDRSSSPDAAIVAISGGGGGAGGASPGLAASGAAGGPGGSPPQTFLIPAPSAQSLVQEELIRGLLEYTHRVELDMFRRDLAASNLDRHEFVQHMTSVLNEPQDHKTVRRMTPDVTPKVAPKVVSPPRMIRSVCGVEVVDLKHSDGTLTRVTADSLKKPDTK